jgi:hypothetical protein
MNQLESIAIDEIAVGKGRQYLTVVLDLQSGAVVFVGEGHDLFSAMATDDQATVTIRVDSPGNIVIDARLMVCGSGGRGRYRAEIPPGEPVTITGEQRGSLRINGAALGR